MNFSDFNLTNFWQFLDKFLRKSWQIIDNFLTNSKKRLQPPFEFKFENGGSYDVVYQIQTD